jgi:hypothetical protein
MLSENKSEFENELHDDTGEIIYHDSCPSIFRERCLDIKVYVPLISLVCVCV